MRSHLVVGLFSSLLLSSLVGCAADADETVDPASEASEIRAARGKVSGFDFAGPKSLPATNTHCAFFRQPDEEIACGAVDGKATQAADCAILCSKPIAKPGKVAGYDFGGYKQIKTTTTHCAFFRQPDEEIACAAVGGVAAQADGCEILCSKPIATKGKVAGYDLRGFKILANDRVPVEFCTEQVSVVQEACVAVGGAVSSANGCKQLCSLPL